MVQKAKEGHEGDDSDSAENYLFRVVGHGQKKRVIKIKFSLFSGPKNPQIRTSAHMHFTRDRLRFAMTFTVLLWARCSLVVLLETVEVQFFLVQSRQSLEQSSK